ncbi:MAG: protein kinase [Sandaracinaceae bacterium]|nr:protein kinase [Sandaracinaceae bacterium]
MAAVGPYELREPIGEGGMAQVFRAVGPESEEVAVKVLRGGADASPEQLARFEREIRIAEGIDHPHLIRVIDHGVDEALGPWLAMPLVRGMTLRDLYARKSLCPEAAVLLLAPLAEALAELHSRGLVHRDVKPENLMVSPLGDVTLVDLGLALAETDTRHTREGEVAGSVPYMAPERIEGRDVDPSADVWAFAVMLYELVVGRRPFERARAGEEVAAILAGTFTPLAEADRRVGADLDWMVSVCLAREPWKRPKDGTALLERMRPLIYGARDDARELRVSVLSDADGFARRVAPRVVEELRAKARQLLGAGDALEAIRQLDRALAYAPDDEETLALVEHASSGEPYEVVAEPAVVTSTQPARRPGWRVWGAAAVVLAVAGAAGTYALLGPDDAATPEPTPEPPAEVVEATPPATDAGAAEPPVTRLDYHPIPPDLLRNDDPPALDDVAAPAGAPLVEGNAVAGDPEGELAAAIRALEDDPDDTHEQVRRAFALLALGRTEEGLRAITALAAAHPDVPEALTASGYVALRRGRFDEADALFSRAIEVDDHFEEALRHRGVLRVRRGQTRDGYVDLQRVLAIDPDNLNALAEMTEVYQRAHRPLDAVPFLRRIVAGHPRHATGWVSLGIALSSSRDPDDIEEAIAATERGLELSPTHVQGLTLRCTLLSQHERAGVVPACTEAIRVTPNNPELFMARAVQLAREDQMAPALADADRAVELAPGVARMYSNRAILRGRSGDLDGAYSDLRVACRLGHEASCARLQSDGVAP